MKRLLAGGLLLLLVAVGIFLWSQNQRSLTGSQIAPVDCLIYFELPDVAQTAKRWPDTALCEILSEPSVEHFLRRPLSQNLANYQTALGSFAALRCRALFFGMTQPDSDRWICGLQTSVDQSTWRREIAAVSNTLFGQNIKEVDPNDLEHHGADAGAGAEVAEQICCVRAGSWILLSRSTELLSEAVRNSKLASGGLQSQKLFQECRANVPIGYDLLSFVQGRPFLDPSAEFHWRFHEQITSGNARAVIAATTIVGARLRDTVFTLTGPRVNTGPLERKGLAMTSPSTIGYLASQVGLSEIWRWCGQFSDETPLAETIRNYVTQVKSFGIESQDLDNLVSGAEIILDRDPKTDALNGTISLHVIDPAKFQRLVGRVIKDRFPASCRTIEIASVPACLIQVNERVSVVFGLVGHLLLVTGSQSNFAELVHRLQGQAPGLESNNEFKAMAKLVAEPNELFAYLDAKSGFERFYEASRPMLVFAIALMPTLNRYLDAMALPNTGDISKHLSPIILSRYRVANGVVDESVGPITAYDAAVLFVGGALAMSLWER
jgi:hypothetical protein